MQLRKDYKIPVLAHNLRGYDGHIIAAALKHVQRADHKLGVIGQGMEKYLQVYLFRRGGHTVF